MPRMRGRLWIVLLSMVAIGFVAGFSTALFLQSRIGMRRGVRAVERDDAGTSSSGNPGLPIARQIEQKYGLKVVWKDGVYPVKSYHGLIQAANASLSDLERYAPTLAGEFLIYPPSLVRRSRLARIVLCRDLSFAGQARAALPDYEHDTLYLDVVSGNYNNAYQRSVIHHEFFHIIDYRDDGEVYSDLQWAKLNPGTFRYGTGGVNMQENRLSSLPTELPGFLTTYATSGVEEDKAELFAHMMVDYAVVGKRATTDKIIREKISAMKRLLGKFCSEIDEPFWNAVNRRETEAP